jgi:tRNA_anti-like
MAEVEPETAPEPEAVVEPELEPESVAKPRTAKPRAAKPRAAKPPAAESAEVSIQELSEAHIASLDAAEQKYSERKIVVTGVIESIGRDLLDNPFVKMMSEDKEALLRVRCTGSGKEYEEKVKLLMDGQRVTVGGTYDGFLVNILLKDCAILKVNGG